MKSGLGEVVYVAVLAVMGIAALSLLFAVLPV
jgi:hypothetical protein